MEYLNLLQQRSKWKMENPVHLKKGMLVLLVEGNEPSTAWKMARITELWPGRDGLTRIVTVRTANGTFKRSVTRICLLPDNDTF